MSDTKPTVVEALSKVMAVVQAVGKDSTNKQQNYRFRGIDAVVNAVGPAFRQHGVICLPHVEHVEYAVVEVGQNRTRMRECTVRVRYVFHGPAGDSLECVAVGEAMDSGDKATPKAMSVAYRVALLQALCIPTDEPDADSQTYERAGRPERSEAKVQAIEFAIGAAKNEHQLKIAWEMVPECVQSGEITEDDARRFSALVKQRRDELAAQPAEQPDTVPTETDVPPSQKQTAAMHALFRDAGIGQDDKYGFMSTVLSEKLPQPREITSAKQLSADDVSLIITRLRERLRAKETADAAA